MRRLALAVAVPLLLLLAPSAFADEAGDTESVTAEEEEAEPAEAEPEAEASEPEAEETDVEVAEEEAEPEDEEEEESGYELKPIDVWAIDLANRVSLGLNGVLTAPADPVMFSLEGDEVFEGFWMPQVTGRVAGFFAGLFVLPHVQYMTAMYDASLRYLDDQLRALFASLRDTGQLDDTIVVVAADHGESLGEHGIFFDHEGLYEPTVRVPLLVWAPGRVPPGRHDAIVGTTDVAPTILALAGVAIPPAMVGRDLLAGGSEPRDAVSESLGLGNPASTYDQRARRVNALRAFTGKAA